MERVILRLNNYLEYISAFLSTGQCPHNYTTLQKKHLVVREANYQLIAGQLYKMELDQVLRHFILNYKCEGVLWECHAGIAGGHVGGKATPQKFLQAGLWWTTPYKDVKSYAKTCDACQWVSQ